MAKYEVRLPKMGEGIIEATLNTWLVNVGDKIEPDDGILEVSTDKVDTEIPSEVSGILIEQRFAEGEVVKVGEVMAVIETAEPDDNQDIPDDTVDVIPAPDVSAAMPEVSPKPADDISLPGQRKFYSPLVKSIAEKEGIGREELDRIPGSGKDGRLTKKDILRYLENRKPSPAPSTDAPSTVQKQVQPAQGDSVIPLDKMAKIIASHMIESVHTSAHVQSFIEIDVTRVVRWREKIKEDFQRKTGEKLTFTAIFMFAVAKTLREFPMVNIQFDGENIIAKKHINLGMAAALPDDNLIVPVIKNADHLSLTGMAKEVNRLAHAARSGKLTPDDISGGTYTVTNVGTFGSITGTPIINQPQCAILALGAIRKVPAVIETGEGDVIAIRHNMMVAHSYDHRVINGALGGKFILRLKQIIENFDFDTES